MTTQFVMFMFLDPYSAELSNASNGSAFFGIFDFTMSMVLRSVAVQSHELIVQILVYESSHFLRMHAFH